MLSDSGLRINHRTDVSEYIVKRCPECDNDFEVLLWTQKGMSKDRNRGWHKVIYCDTCSQERSRIRRTYAYRQKRVKHGV